MKDKPRHRVTITLASLNRVVIRVRSHPGLQKCLDAQGRMTEWRNGFEAGISELYRAMEFYAERK